MQFLFIMLLVNEIGAERGLVLWRGGHQFRLPSFTFAGCLVLRSCLIWSVTERPLARPGVPPLAARYASTHTEKPTGSCAIDTQRDAHASVTQVLHTEERTLLWLAWYPSTIDVIKYTPSMLSVQVSTVTPPGLSHSPKQSKDT